MAETAGTVENLAPGYDAAKANVLSSYANLRQQGDVAAAKAPQMAVDLSAQNMAASQATAGTQANDAAWMNERYEAMIRGVAAEMSIMARSQQLAQARNEAALESYLTSLQAALPAVESRMEASLQSALARMGGGGGGGTEEEGEEEPIDVFNDAIERATGGLEVNFGADDFNEGDAGIFGEIDAGIITANQEMTEESLGFSETPVDYDKDGQPIYSLGQGYRELIGPDAPFFLQEANLAFQEIYGDPDLNDMTMEIMGGLPSIDASIAQIKASVIRLAQERGESLTKYELEQLTAWGIMQQQRYDMSTGRATDESTSAARKQFEDSKKNQLLAYRLGTQGTPSLSDLPDDEHLGAAALTGLGRVTHHQVSKDIQEAQQKQEDVEILAEAQDAPTASYEVYGQHGKTDPATNRVERARFKEMDAEIGRIEGLLEDTTLSPDVRSSLETQLSAIKAIKSSDPANLEPKKKIAAVDEYWRTYGKGPKTRDQDAVAAYSASLASPINVSVNWPSSQVRDDPDTPDIDETGMGSVVDRFVQSVEQQRSQQMASRQGGAIEGQLAEYAKQWRTGRKDQIPLTKKEEETAWAHAFKGWSSPTASN